VGHLKGFHYRTKSHNDIIRNHILVGLEKSIRVCIERETECSAFIFDYFESAEQPEKYRLPEREEH
jgi:hypothetical protein